MTVKKKAVSKLTKDEMFKELDYLGNAFEAVLGDPDGRILRLVVALRDLIIRYKQMDILVDKEISRIENDERYHYPSALVHINAPLALIQTALEAEMNILLKVCPTLRVIEKEG